GPWGTGVLYTDIYGSQNMVCPPRGGGYNPRNFKQGRPCVRRLRLLGAPAIPHRKAALSCLHRQRTNSASAVYVAIGAVHAGAGASDRSDGEKHRPIYF